MLEPIPMIRTSAGRWRSARVRLRRAWMAGAAGALFLCQHASASPAPVRTSLAEAFFIQRHPVTGSVEWLGSGIIWLLMAMSVACLGILGAMLLENRRDRIAPKALGDALPGAGAGGAEGVRSRIAGDASVLAASMEAALDAQRLGQDAMLHAAEDRLDELTVQRLRSIEPLSVIGNIAPMIGLFGTVYGMILAFREIVVSGGSPDPVGLAAGIGTALTTTFWGLVVAIPALAGHALIRNAIDARTFAALRIVERTIERLAGADGAATGGSLGRDRERADGALQGT
ncbi:MAG: MotA/TolQ/ExbB proton channel family protein [Phycisphaerales bacterium]